MSGCGCCACLAGAGEPVAIINRPGLSALGYRVGTYGSFLDAMIRRLTIPVSSLHGLTTREEDDPAIALLDAWATVGDVLTFYQERIANEGYLRTATERRSILELGRLVGYKLKPGVSASVYLAYTIDANTKTTVIPAGSKAQSIPGANEQPQMFETADDIEARGAWSALLPRMSKAQVITLSTVLSIESVWSKGTSIQINAGDSLLFVFRRKNANVYAIRRAAKVNPDPANDRTEIVLEPIRKYYTDLYKNAYAELVKWEAVTTTAASPAPETKKSRSKKAAENGPDLHVPVLTELVQEILLGATHEDLQYFADVLARHFNDETALYDEILAGEKPDVVEPVEVHPVNVNTLVKRLAEAPGNAPRNQWTLARQLDFSKSSDSLPRLVQTFLPRVSDALYFTIGNAMTEYRRLAVKEPEIYVESVYVLHKKAAVFGYNAPTALFEEANPDAKLPVPKDVEEWADVVHLDTPIESLTRGTYVVLKRPADTGNLARRRTVVRTANSVESLPRSAYTISAKTTRLTLDDDWADLTTANLKNNLAIIRRTSILTDSEELTLAQIPITDAVGESHTRIELDAVVEGLKPGRWVIVSGERADTPGTSGVMANELAMIADVQLEPAIANGSAYSVLVLAPEGIQYRYKRATVTIYGNVVKATHGETFNEILGAGDASKALQTFTLHQKPLTYVAAATQEGVTSTLAVRVNDVLWHEQDTLLGAAPTGRVFVTKIADDGTVFVTFGDGREGSRVMTGPDNVRATYRRGIGAAGNVRAGQIATAISRPLGVKDVVNPIAANGGADPESRDDARTNIPVSLRALGRVISVQDFADFARTFSGISKATAAMLSDGRRQVVHLTIGGTGGMDIDETSDLYNTLVDALGKFGDPYQPYRVQQRERLVIAGSANVRVDPDYLWEKVAPQVRAKLLDVFSYDRRDFAQVAFPAEAIAAIQSVEGVAYVDLDTFGGISVRDIVTDKSSHFLTPKLKGAKPVIPAFATFSKNERDFVAAQIAYLPPEMSDLFVLTEIKNDQ